MVLLCQVIESIKDGKIPKFREDILEEVVVGYDKRKGFDLVRVGNFAESEDMLQVICNA